MGHCPLSAAWLMAAAPCPPQDVACACAAGSTVVGLLCAALALAAPPFPAAVIGLLAFAAPTVGAIVGFEWRGAPSGPK